ncbi:hypothetical protein M3Y98_00331500 [Aphelenchoides besseyi]|nr:hypothetical protein M3Y98_00331500 [Aphelenchoides besseyi]KAI6201520.1 hypothetical protein M3Y96_00850900 [Aphelenchoides besseyi]
MFNRKERNKMAHKLKGKYDLRIIQKEYGKKKYEKRQQREERLINSAVNIPDDEKIVSMNEEQEMQITGNNTNIVSQKKWYSLSVALPGSILNNAQGPQLRSYLAGIIARTCCVFCVDEVVIFDETARLTDKQLEAYYAGSWTGEEWPTAQNVECNLHLARILEYMECPQYLRKSLFPAQIALKNAGVLNPLDGMHHLRADDFTVPYREGVVLAKNVKPGHGSFCDVGLDRDLELADGKTLPPGTRVTVELIETNSTKKPYCGRLISPKSIRNQSGIYWGYSVRIAKSLSDVFSKKYDLIVGTSERGDAINEVEIPREKNTTKILVVFGGLDGLESAVNSDEQIDVENPKDLFQVYVNSLPDQGSRIIRTEEAIPITLTALKCRLDQLEKSR